MTEIGQSARVVFLIKDTVSRLLSDAAARDSAIQQIGKISDSSIAPQAETVLASTNLSYRDGLLIQFAYRLTMTNPTVGLNVAERHSGARSVAAQVGTFFSENHIPAVKDAYQNIGKNSTNLVRGNFREFDALLLWASKTTTSLGDIASVFAYGCAHVARTARAVKQMPQVDRAALSFAKVGALAQELFKMGSGGAYEQFVIAALLQALVEQSNLAGVRVETKTLNASDKSSRAAGDIQILSGNRVIEAYEVTANAWRTKLAGAGKTIKDHDLARMNIIAKADNEPLGMLLAELAQKTDDVAVLDLGHYASALIATLTRPFRAAALARLYEYLDRYQPDVALVNSYVDALISSKLTVGAES
jgi:hypothetical protein